MADHAVHRVAARCPVRRCAAAMRSECPENSNQLPFRKIGADATQKAPNPWRRRSVCLRAGGFGVLLCRFDEASSRTGRGGGFGGAAGTRPTSRTRSTMSGRSSVASQIGEVVETPSSTFVDQPPSWPCSETIRRPCAAASINPRRARIFCRRQRGHHPAVPRCVTVGMRCAKWTVVKRQTEALVTGLNDQNGLLAPFRTSQSSKMASFQGIIAACQNVCDKSGESLPSILCLGGG